ncbi:MAG: hypothetical protein HY912_04750, partial [Desulfomonile tiedjei]|nr:hypothetical protein [Desulfomonile tiedjei]
RLVGMRCPLDILEQKSMELDRKINEALSKDPNLKQFVESIEGNRPRGDSTSEDNIIRLNDFLKRDHPKEPDE